MLLLRTSEFNMINKHENYQLCNFLLDGRIPRWNFKDFLHAFMIVFRVLCGEWIESMWNCMRAANPYICIPFFLLTHVIGNMVVSVISQLNTNEVLACILTKSVTTDPLYSYSLEISSRLLHFVLTVNNSLWLCCGKPLVRVVLLWI